MRMRDIQMYLEKFTDGNKGTAISDCQVYIEMQDGSLQEIKKMELQECRRLESGYERRSKISTQTNSRL